MIELSTEFPGANRGECRFERVCICCDAERLDRLFGLPEPVASGFLLSTRCVVALHRSRTHLDQVVQRPERGSRQQQLGRVDARRASQSLEIPGNLSCHCVQFALAGRDVEGSPAIPHLLILESVELLSQIEDHRVHFDGAQLAVESRQVLFCSADFGSGRGLLSGKPVCFLHPADRRIRKSLQRHQVPL